MRWHEIFESTTAGATAAGNVATVAGSGGVGGIGAGFDPDGDWGVYNSAKPKKGKKNSGDGVIRRPKVV